MDQFLAEYYGTGAADGMSYADDDIEKMAQLTLLTKEAAAEGVDLSAFSDEELLTMADDLYGGGNEDELEKEAAAKFEEADFLGRVMAHSFEQERFEIEKEAASLAGARDAVVGAAKRGWEGTKNVAGYAKRRAAAAGRSLSATQMGARTISPTKTRGMIAKERRRLLDAGHDINKIDSQAAQNVNKEVGAMARRRGIGMYAGAGGAAAALGGGGAYLATRKDKKSSDSAFEQLVMERANEHLEAAGLIDKTAGDDDFDTVVDRAALELLEANGYPVEWY